MQVKINYYIPKKKITNNEFMIAIKKIILQNIINLENELDKKSVSSDIEESGLNNDSIKNYIISDESEIESSIEEDIDDEDNLKINDILDSILEESKRKNTLLLDRIIKKENFNNYEEILNNKKKEFEKN